MPKTAAVDSPTERLADRVSDRGKELDVDRPAAARLVAWRPTRRVQAAGLARRAARTSAVELAAVLRVIELNAD